MARAGSEAELPCCSTMSERLLHEGLVHLFFAPSSPHPHAAVVRRARPTDRGECQNQKDIRRNLAKAGFDIIVPDVVEELCSRKLMVMEEIYPATPLHDQLEAQAEKMARGTASAPAT